MKYERKIAGEMKYRLRVYEILVLLPPETYTGNVCVCVCVCVCACVDEDVLRAEVVWVMAGNTLWGVGGAFWEDQINTEACAGGGGDQSPTTRSEAPRGV